ncbi:glycosyltransferase [Caminicella sporogenes]|uniref:glycosyltransferase n=1 Tax=Caminicella sporogenes TaxID=166485 RepID=UPI002541EC50|nr:glycosyltransferase [Caminicella sporogenes]WIF95318.1 glycosyltransferase [Caminicella sporogenes]
MKKEVVIFSLLNWESKLLHRSHMLAKYFQKAGFKVIYIQKENVHETFRLGFKPKVKKDKEITIMSLPALPYLKGKISYIYKLNDIILTKQLTKIFKLFDDPFIILESPYWIRAVISSRGNKGIVCYDISDDFSQFATNEKWKSKLLEYEEETIQKSDYIFVTASELKNKVKDKKVFLIENGVDLDGFQDAKNILAHDYKKPICGFIGGLFEWVNFELIEKCAKSYPNYDFVLIGPTDRKEKIDELCRISNIHYLGEKDKKDIGDYFKSLDMGIIPFVSENVYPRLKTVNSNKVFQYCYFGYPIVSTNFGQVRDLNDIIDVADTDEEFISKLGIAMEKNNENLEEKRRKFAIDNSWEQRIKQMIAAVFEK